MPGKKRKLWKDEDMVAAIESVQGGSSVNKDFEVPQRTLDDRIRGHVVHSSKSGPSTVLSEAEEDALVSCLVYMAERGFPLTRKMVCAFAWAIAIRVGKGDRFTSNGPSKHWWSNFLRRHPRLTLRKAERSRAEALSPDVVDRYFTLLEETLARYKIKCSPRLIYNCDETSCH